MEASVTIDCTAEQVWRFMVDLSNTPKWDPYVLEAKQSTPGPLGVGVAVQLKRRHFYRNEEAVVRQRVVEYVPNQRFALEYSSGPIKGTRVDYIVEDIGGKARLSRALDLKIGGFYKLMGPFVARRSKKENEVNLGTVKRILESETQT